MNTNAKSIRKKARHRNIQSKGLIWTGIIILALAVWVAWNILQPVTSASTPTGRTGVQVGDLFPDFTVTEVDGQTITRDALKGKPAIIWFTTSYCVPCQIGARVVAKLDNELGGKAFNVLVIFVEPGERDSDLRAWRKDFANPDWLVAFDNQATSLAQKVNLGYLDTKFLLDKNGIIKNTDLKTADENYLNTIKQVVEENK